MTLNDNLATEGTETMRQPLRSVPAELEQPIAEQDQIEAAINEAAEEAAADAMESALQSIQSEIEPPSNKNLIRRSKASLAKQLPELADREAKLQVRMAAAKTARDTTIARAEAEFAAINSDVEAELYQISTMKRILDWAVGECTKAEL